MIVTSTSYFLYLYFLLLNPPALLLMMFFAFHFRTHTFREASVSSLAPGCHLEFFRAIFMNASNRDVGQGIYFTNIGLGFRFVPRVQVHNVSSGTTFAYSSHSFSKLSLPDLLIYRHSARNIKKL